jgi:glyoxylase-like metal-dependent hydrolase (beta-lactamase superfamily II)
MHRKRASEQMETEITGLYASAPEPLGFAPGLDVRAFGLRRDPGSLLIYSVRGLDADPPMFEDLAPISRQYLNHWHQAAFISDRVDPPLFVHENERSSVAESRPVEQTFSKRHMLDEDFEVIPTPGHTSGATSFLWETEEHRLLFTGDTIYLDEGEWGAVVLDESDRGVYIESLELIRELDFDVLVPWVARGLPYYQVTDGAATRRRIDALIADLRQRLG